MTRYIYVLQARWVFIGDLVKEHPKHDQLTNTSVIRVWGTTKGLGEIALNGPTKKTELDPCGDTDIPHAAVLFRIKCRD
jgi:hypothetical protein